MQNKIEIFKTNDFDKLFRYQFDFAKETENLTLEESNVNSALKFIQKHQNLATYYITRMIDEDIGGCHMITYGYDLYLNKAINWFQSVYVPPKHRKKGIFKAMFDNIQKIHFMEKKNLKLFVHRGNKLAIGMYESFGMENKGEVFIQKDFYFTKGNLKFSRNHEIEFNIGVIRWKNNNFYFDKKNSKLKLMEFLAGDNSVLEMKILCKETAQLKKLETIQLENINLQKEAIIITSYYKNQLIGFFLASFDVSDWTNGLNLNFYDFELKIDDKFLKEFYESFLGYFQNNFKLGIKFTWVKFLVLRENLKLKKIQNLLDNGFEEGEFYLFEKNNN